MSGPTDGPWHRNIRPARKYPGIFHGRNTHIAQLVPGNLSDEDAEAILDLIVSAPELLAACKSARDELTRLQALLDHDEDHDSIEAVIGTLDEAISKAEQP